ncbi:MAG: indole-3-glycerol phosphate synthase TrpC [Lachnospiraceae bacterium]|nr:indole-3-glycerol phosphate synthase TrpC [Lachnospiraceae bacterium]
MTILDELANYARLRVKADIEKISREEIIEKACDIVKAEHAVINDKSLIDGKLRLESMEEYRKLPGRQRSFRQALAKLEFSLICEIKKASPSKGIISEDFPYLDIAREYEKYGADCVSCLTEPKWFLGSDEIFKEIRQEISIPMIRKDFTVDEYQIYQAKTMGANAVLLICSILDTKTIEKYLGICSELCMDALVETHNEEEIRSAVDAGAKIIGVNNRNLKDFTVDFKLAEKLRAMIPRTKVYVAESGVKSKEDVRILKEIGADAALIGEALMRAKDKEAMIREFKEA